MSQISSPTSILQRCLLHDNSTMICESIESVGLVMPPLTSRGVKDSRRYYWLRWIHVTFNGLNLVVLFFYLLLLKYLYTLCWNSIHHWWICQHGEPWKVQWISARCSEFFTKWCSSNLPTVLIASLDRSDGVSFYWLNINLVNIASCKNIIFQTLQMQMILFT